MTPGTEPALTPDEWLSGVNRGKTIRGGNPKNIQDVGKGPLIPLICRLSADPILMSLKEGYKRNSKIVFKAPVREKKSVVVNGIDLLENVPPRTENEVGQSGSGNGSGNGRENGNGNRN